MGRLVRPNPGDVVRADDIVQLIDWVESRTTIRGGPGISVSASERMITIALAAAFREIFVPAVITASNGTLPDSLPAAATYSAVAVGRAGATITNRMPDMGRPLVNSRVVPGKVGDPCFIVISKDQNGETGALLYVITERVPTYQCVSSGGGLGDGGGGGGGGGVGAGGGMAADESQRLDAMVKLLADRVAGELRERGVVTK